MEINYKKKHFWYVLLFAVVLVSLTINLSVSLPEKLVFGDEGYYAVRGEYIAENLEIPKYGALFGESDVFNSFLLKTPQTFFLLSSFFLIAGKMGMRAFVSIISIISALLLFLLTKKVHSLRAGVLAATFYLIMPALITHTIFLYTEHLALMFLIASFYFLYNYFSKEDMKYLVASGLFLGFSILAEPTAFVGLLVFVFVLFLYKTSWKNWFKEILIIFVLSLLIISPWMFVHNYAQTGNPGFKVGKVFGGVPGLDVNTDTQIIKSDYTELETKGLESAPEVGQGTGAPLHKYGLLSYTQFAYTLPVFLLALLGFSFYFVDRKKKYWIVILWAVLIFSSVYFLMYGSRVEDLSRNTLFVIAPLAMAAGFFSSKIYEYLKDFREWYVIFPSLLGTFLLFIIYWNLGILNFIWTVIGIGLVISLFLIWIYIKMKDMKSISIGLVMILIVTVFTLNSAYTKAESLRPVKHFSSAFYKGCDWIKSNTPEGSLIYTLWGHRAEYHCKRSTIGNDNPGIGDAIVSANNSTYQVFKEHGIDYLYLQKFSIKRGRKKVSYPLSFVQYVIQSPHYKQVYSYPQNCLYKQKVTDCVIVYELIEGKNQTQQIDMSNLVSQGNTNLQEGD